MNYVEVSFRIDPLEPWRDILIAELGLLGYESFVEDADGLKAYIQEHEFNRLNINKLWATSDPHVSISLTHKVIKDRNWNAEWEKSFEPIIVAGKVHIRAEFHPPCSAHQHDLVITPRMAFGTGHHATTQVMIRAMLGINLAGSHVCDLGCGTAVLAMLAEKEGASTVHAIDIDQNAVDNANDNIIRNGCNKITVEKGDAISLKPNAYDHILANIERNTLVNDMARMTAALTSNGRLLLSGFVDRDEDKVRQAAKDDGLTWGGTLREGEWVMIIMER